MLAIRSWPSVGTSMGSVGFLECWSITTNIFINIIRLLSYLYMTVIPFINLPEEYWLIIWIIIDFWFAHCNQYWFLIFISFFFALFWGDFLLHCYSYFLNLKILIFQKLTYLADPKTPKPWSLVYFWRNRINYLVDFFNYYFCP